TRWASPVYSVQRQRKRTDRAAKRRSTSGTVSHAARQGERAGHRGMAVSEDRVLLGLRGPVIRGFAVIVELRLEERDEELRLRRIAPNEKRYRKHFADLSGLGIRDLALDGDNIVILAGPTMGLSGPWSLLRWRDGMAQTEEGIVNKANLALLMPMEPK